MKGTYNNLIINPKETSVEGIVYQTATVDVTSLFFRQTKRYDIFRKKPIETSQDYTIVFNWYFRDSGKMVQPSDIIHLEKIQIGEQLK